MSPFLFPSPVQLVLLSSSAGRSALKVTVSSVRSQTEKTVLSTFTSSDPLLWNWGCVLASLMNSWCCSFSGVSLKMEAGLSYRVVALMPQFFCKSSFIALVTQRLWVASGPKKCSYLEEDGNQKIYISIKVFCDPFCPNYKPRNYTAFKVQEVSDPTFTPRKSDLSYQRNIL